MSTVKDLVKFGNAMLYAYQVKDYKGDDVLLPGEFELFLYIPSIILFSQDFLYFSFLFNIFVYSFQFVYVIGLHAVQLRNNWTRKIPKTV